MLLKQLEVLLEVKEAHIHHVDQILSIVWVELLLLHFCQVKDLLLCNQVNFRELDVLFGASVFVLLSWLLVAVVVEGFNECLAFLLEEDLLVGWLRCSLKLLLWSFRFDHWTGLGLILVNIGFNLEVIGFIGLSIDFNGFVLGASFELLDHSEGFQHDWLWRGGSINQNLVGGRSYLDWLGRPFGCCVLLEADFLFFLLGLLLEHLWSLLWRSCCLCSVLRLQRELRHVVILTHELKRSLL